MKWKTACFLTLIASYHAISMKIESVKFSSVDGAHSLVRRERKVVVNNVTTLLNQILENYNRHLRPGFNSKQTTVFIDIFVRTMGPIADLTDTYSFNCYFRQMWTDTRLKFNDTHNKQLSLNMAMLDKIWRPDTYFWNGARSYTHTMTTSNRLVRLHPDGTVLFSSRLTIKGKCAMSMRRYPLDRQVCRLVIGSYAFGADELLYDWRKMGSDRGVQMDYDGINDLAQFSMIGFQVFNSTNMTRDRNYSALEVRFYFDRHFGYFLMNFYVPCTLIVLLCWVALWTNREATGDRIGMGITSVLTMVLIANDSKSDAPKVNFPTALDIYIWICYTTLLICMVEFTVVHYHTKFNTGDPEIQALEREKMRRIIRRIPKTAVLSSRRPYRKPMQISPQLRAGITRRDGGRHSMYQRVRKVSTKKKVTGQLSVSSCDGPDSPNITEFQQDSVGWRLYYWMMNNGRPTDPFGLAENSISSVDQFSRIALPIYFVAVVVVYYNFYVHTPYSFHFEDDCSKSCVNM